MITPDKEQRTGTHWKDPGLKNDTRALVLLWVILALAIAQLVVATWNVVTHGDYPQSTSDCPPGHVYIDYGETPQAGCWPEGVAREMGVWPQP